MSPNLVTKWTSIVVAMWLAFGVAERGCAQVVTNLSYNLVLQGDDPGELFRYDLPGSTLVPSLVRFEGFFENLEPSETGVRYDFSWGSSGDAGALGGYEVIDFTRLPASGRLPVQFTRWAWHTPQNLVVHIEGGGPSDHFRFVGELIIQQVSAPVRANCLPPMGIVGWWPGDAVTHDVISGRHATLRGGASLGPGLVREAFTLNGDQQFIEVADDPGLNVGTNDFTFELWVRFNNVDGEQVIAEKYVETMAASPPPAGWTVTKLPNNEVRLALAGGQNVDSLPAGTILPGTDTWTHIAVRRSGNTFTTFQNGSPTASGEFSVNLDSRSSLKFGHRGNPSDTPGSVDTRDFWLNGAIDEPALYKRALSDQEIAAIFQAGADGKCRRPVMLGVARAFDGNVRASVKGIPGLAHVLQVSTDLTHWSSLVTNVPGSEVFQLEATDVTSPHGFYRAVEVH